MRVLGAVLGAIGLAKGVALVAAPREFVRMWTAEDLPPWIRERAQPWADLPEETLRQTGAGILFISTVLLCVSSHRER